MEKQKTIKLDFFSICPAKESEITSVELERKVSTTFQNLPKSGTMKPLSTSDGVIIAYGDFLKKEGCVLGTLVRCQSSDIPPKINQKTHVLTPLDFSELEGLGYSSCFLFDVQAGVVVMERTSKGPSVHSFTRFFPNTIDMPKLLSSIIINPVDVEKFYQMGHISKVHIKIAKVENGNIFKKADKKRGVLQIMEPADDTNAGILEIRMGVKKKKESLVPEKIKGIFRDLLDFKDTEEVQILSVVGSEDEEGSPLALDLIKQRLVETFKTDKQRLNGDFLIMEKFHQMETLYNIHRPGILRTYKLIKNA